MHLPTPGTHSVGAMGDGASASSISVPTATIDYDEVVLDFLDHYVRGIDNAFAGAPPVRRVTHSISSAHIRRR